MAAEQEGRVEEIEKSVGSLESQIRAQIARTQSGTRAVLVVGIIVVIIIFAYFAWLSSLIKTVAEPVAFADSLMGITQAEEKVAKFMDTLEDSLTKRAPELVTRLREEALPRVPELMQQVEDTLISQAPARVTAMREQALQQAPVLRRRAEERIQGVHLLSELLV